MTPSDILQYSLVSTVLRHDQRSYLLKHLGRNRNAQVNNIQREYVTLRLSVLKHSSLNQISLSNPYPGNQTMNIVLIESCGVYASK